VIILCRIHLGLLEKNAHPNGTTHSSPHPVRIFHAATRRIHDAVVDEFGDRSITGTPDTGSSSPDDIELQECHSSNTGQIDLDEFPWAGMSLGGLENRSREIESQNSGKLLPIAFLDVTRNCLQGQFPECEHDILPV
jgi:hypothetical protein